MRRFADLCLDVQITELDVQIWDGTGITREGLLAQAEAFRTMPDVGLSIPSFTALVQWGVTDRSTWIPECWGHPDAPLLFDDRYQPKPAYCALRDLLAGMGIWPLPNGSIDQPRSTSFARMISSPKPEVRRVP